MGIRYGDLGLVNTKKMFAAALGGGWAVPAYNFNNLEQLRAIVLGCLETRSPVIIQVSSSARKYAGAPFVRHLAQAAVELAASHDAGPVPIALHLDHGATFELAKECIDDGFSSVMIDGSALPFEENAALTKEVVDYAHPLDVTVEGELGVLAGVEDEVSHELSLYTDPEEAEEFVRLTGVDSLAISIGTSHGAYKFKPGQKPKLRFDILDEVARRMPDLPVVLHGASSVPREYIEEINRLGGSLKEAIGIPEDQIRRAARGVVCKVNIDSDGRLAFTAALRRSFTEGPGVFDPRKYLGAAMETVKALVMDKNTEVLSSSGRAQEVG